MKYHFLSTLAFVLFCSCNNHRDFSEPNSLNIDVIDKISLEINDAYPSHFNLVSISADSTLIVGFEGRDNKLFYFDINGNPVRSFNLPTIDQPTGINTLSDVHIISKDSVLLYDGQFLRIVLMNSENEIIDYWSLRDFWDRGTVSANVGIVDAYFSKGELFVEIIAFENTYYITSREFYQKTRLLHRINLSKNQVKSGIGYPEDSPYQRQMFFAGFSPYISKFNGGYIVSFPFDRDIYIYNEQMDFSFSLNTSPINFPKANGQPFNTQQENNAVLISRKLNGFGLATKDVLNIEGADRCFIRVYREPLGDVDEIPNDIRSFSSLSYPSTFNLQLFQISDQGESLVKLAEKRRINSLDLGNYIGQDSDGFTYFLENNPEIEDIRLIKTKLSLDAN